MTFTEDGYEIVRGAIDTTTYYEYAMNKLKNNKFVSDQQIKNTPAYYNDTIMNVIQEQLRPILEKVTSKKLFTTYNYYRVYKKGDVLDPHTDRPSCEISASLCLGFVSKEIWNLCLRDYRRNTIEADLKPGDMLVYDGVNLEHWRDRFKGHHQVQLFLHYVDQNGPFTAHKDDKIRQEQVGVIQQVI